MLASDSEIQRALQRLARDNRGLLAFTALEQVNTARMSLLLRILTVTHIEVGPSEHIFFGSSP